MATKPIGLCIALLFGLGCAHFDSRSRPEERVTVPKAYSLYPGEQRKLGPWWKQFNSIELNGLIEKALSSGFSIQEAWARLRQAEARAVQARADRVPDFNISGSSRYTERQESGAGDVQNASVDRGRSGGGSEFYSLSLASSYELDLWGRVRATSKAAGFDVVASREDFRTAALTVSAEVAEVWLNLISQREQLDLLTRQIATNQEILELLQLRFLNGLSSAVDVYQQKQILAQVEATRPLVRAEEKALEMQLAVLLGILPLELKVKTQKPTHSRTSASGWVPYRFTGQPTRY